MSRIHHFIHIKHLNLLYGRVPKVANTSIKAVLCRLLPQKPNRGIKTTSDRFWRDYTHQQTELLSPGQARKLRSTHFSFSFVRNPFDRLVAAYNNKVIEIEAPPHVALRCGWAALRFLLICLLCGFTHRTYRAPAVLPAVYVAWL